MNSNNYKIGLAGNPNTGKSTLFNMLTGLRQHTGNWPGKTVAHAEGEFEYNSHFYTIIDLPGTYSLFSNSADEEVARDYIVFEKPDVTLVVLDATSLERNLNLAIQVLEITDRTIVCVNLIDEAEKKGIIINERKLEKKLGVPVVKISARNKIGIDRLLQTIENMVSGKIKTNPIKMKYSESIERKGDQLIPIVEETIGNHYPSRWIALRLLDGDKNLLESIKKRESSLSGGGVVSGLTASIES